MSQVFPSSRRWLRAGAHRSPASQHDVTNGGRRMSPTPSRQGRLHYPGTGIAPLAWVFILALVSFAPHAARAQVLYGSLTGNVTDQTGAAIAGARVEVLNPGTGVAK